jgi:pyruvate kinase
MECVCVVLSSTLVTCHCSLSLLVTAKDPAGVFVTVRVLNTAKIGAKKNMNLPMCEVHLPALSEQDKKDLA